MKIIGIYTLNKNVEMYEILLYMSIISLVILKKIRQMINSLKF